MAVSEEKVVKIDEFKAATRSVRLNSAERSVRLHADLSDDGPAPEPRTLTPREVSHRFAMLAFLRQAR